MGRVAASAWGPGGIGRFSSKKDNPTAGQTAAHALPAFYPALERANALLKRTGKALERITLDPWRIAPSPPPRSSYSNSRSPNAPD
jgi:hypothetical protein